MLAMWTSANHECKNFPFLYISTTHFTLSFQCYVLITLMTHLMVWLCLGTTTTWLEIDKDHVLAYLVLLPKRGWKLS